MKKETKSQYWFTIEPYVYVCLKDNEVLLYNTLDGVTIESNIIEVIELLKKVLKKENNGVILLLDKDLLNKNIVEFIKELREKYMGDIIDTTLSKGKPVQIPPLYNFIDSDMQEIYKRHNFTLKRDVFEKLYEINIHIDDTTNTTKLISFLQTIPQNIYINLIGTLSDITKYKEFLSFLNQYPNSKNITCSYTSIFQLQSCCKNNFTYKIIIDFPIDMESFYNSHKILSYQSLPYEYIFNISSLEDYQITENLIKQFNIKSYTIKPIYTGKNIDFFRENVFLTKEDILSSPISLKDIFTHQSINTNDFGKINIMPNGDVYANLNHPSLGNIYKDYFDDLIWKEIKIGKSWRRIRNQEPCNKCIFQWLCPSPSDYEIKIGYPNLCYIKQHKRYEKDE